MNARAGMGRRGALALGVMTLLSACAEPAQDAPDAGQTADLRTDPEPLERRFAALGPLSEPHWLGIRLGADSGSRVDVPGPTDVRVVGFARLGKGRLDALVADPRYDFRPAELPRLPQKLAQFTGAGGGWLRGEAFDRRVTGGTYTGAFYLHPATGRVCFDTVNPEAAPAPSGSGKPQD